MCALARNDNFLLWFFLVCYLHHGEPDDLVTDLEALLEHLGKGVLFQLVQPVDDEQVFLGFVLQRLHEQKLEQAVIRLPYNTRLRELS